MFTVQLQTNRALESNWRKNLASLTPSLLTKCRCTRYRQKILLWYSHMLAPFAHSRSIFCCGVRPRDLWEVLSSFHPAFSLQKPSWMSALPTTHCASLWEKLQGRGEVRASSHAIPSRQSLCVTNGCKLPFPQISEVSVSPSFASYSMSSGRFYCGNPIRSSAPFEVFSPHITFPGASWPFLSPAGDSLKWWCHLNNCLVLQMLKTWLG